MFDVGFWEMAFIGIIALVVVGPEKLPKVARTVGLWVGKGRRMIHDVKADIRKEMNEEDLKDFRNIKDELTSAKDNVRNMAESASESFGIKEAGEEIKSSIDKAKDDLKAIETLDGSEIEASQSGNKKTTTQKKPIAKKPAKKTATKKATTKKTASKKTSSKKTSSKKASSKKASTKKTGAKKATATKTPALKKETEKGVDNPVSLDQT